MNESQIKDGLRNIAVLEPALGFDPDEVAVRAAKRQKTRSVALVAGAAAIVAGLVTTAMLVVPSMGGTAPPAARETVTPFERNKRHFLEVGPTKITGIRNFTVGDTQRPYYPYHPEGSVLMTAMFQTRVGTGKAHLVISPVAPPADIGYPTPEQCVPGNAMPQYDSCRLVAQEDGSTVVVASSRRPMGPSMASVSMDVVAIHHRKDGTYVAVMTIAALAAEGESKPPNVAEDETIALATDPAFNLR